MAENKGRFMRLPPEAHAALEKVDDPAQHVADLIALGPFKWLEWLVTDANMRIQAAWTHLRSQGWKREELLAACDVLNGYHMHRHTGQPHPGRWVGIELADAGRLDAIHGKWDVTPERWAELVAMVDDATGDALVEITTAFWHDQPEVMRRLEWEG